MSAADNVVHQEVKETSGNYYTITVLEGSDPYRLRFRSSQPGSSDEHEIEFMESTLKKVVADRDDLLGPAKKMELIGFLMNRIEVAAEDGRLQLVIEGLGNAGGSGREEAIIPGTSPYST